MNVFAKDMRFGLKSFLLWTLALFVFVFVGSIKFTGMEAGGADAMNALFDSFPRIVLAVMGFSDADITTFSGFYGLLEVYVTIIVAVFAVHAGGTAVSRERVDKTYEFLFTKPRSRSSILAAKMAAGVVFLALLCLLNLAFSQAASMTLGLTEDLLATFSCFSIAQFLVGPVFFSLGALLGAVAPAPEIGARIGNVSVLVFYMMGVVYSSFDNVGFLRVLTPFKYFDQTALSGHELELPFVVLALGLSAVALACAFWSFKRRDLVAA
ncbi:MAG: ABC transporter permease subunit [Gordonibacter sp.]|uniref:ABC transporter permease subunit n=1 Tax=Gordonibacter sp. TaxID=1968902 RepID=UPI002FC76065